MSPSASVISTSLAAKLDLEGHLKLTDKVVQINTEQNCAHMLVSFAR